MRKVLSCKQTFMLKFTHTHTNTRCAILARLSDFPVVVYEKKKEETQTMPSLHPIVMRATVIFVSHHPKVDVHRSPVAFHNGRHHMLGLRAAKDDIASFEWNCGWLCAVFRAHVQHSALKCVAGMQEHGKHGRLTAVRVPAHAVSADRCASIPKPICLLEGIVEGVCRHERMEAGMQPAPVGVQGCAGQGIPRGRAALPKALIQAQVRLRRSDRTVAAR